MNKTVSDQVAKNPTQFNIAAIAKLEEEALDRRTRTERDSDAIVKFIGSVKFLVLHVILVAVWSVLLPPKASSSPSVCLSVRIAWLARRSGVPTSIFRSACLLNRSSP